MAGMPPGTVLDALRRRLRTSAASPFLTYYDLDTGERTELSLASYANWVNKATNLIGACDAADGGSVLAPLALDHPGHWLSLILPLAAWQAGASYQVGPLDSVPADVVVVGPEKPVAARSGTTFACSLHPLALPSRNLPPSVIDFTSEVLAQADQVWIQPPWMDGDPAWTDSQRQLTKRDLAAVAATAGRRLVRPADPWTTLREAVIAPLLGSGSSVVVVGDADPARLARIGQSERCVE